MPAADRHGTFSGADRNGHGSIGINRVGTAGCSGRAEITVDANRVVESIWSFASERLVVFLPVIGKATAAISVKSHLDVVATHNTVNRRFEGLLEQGIAQFPDFVAAVQRRHIHGC